VEEAAEKVRKYNAWREEHGYQNIGFASVEEEFNTVGLHKLRIQLTPKIACTRLVSSLTVTSRFLILTVTSRFQAFAFTRTLFRSAAGKAVLLDERDLLGRQVVAVTLTKHVIAERDLVGRSQVDP
jgi:hypothetical protein